MPVGTLSPSDITKFRKLNTINDANANDIRLGISQSKRLSGISLRYTPITIAQFVTITNIIRNYGKTTNQLQGLLDANAEGGMIVDGNSDTPELILDGN